MGVRARLFIANILFVLCWSVVAMAPALARFQTIIPSIPEAHSLLDEGIAFFEQADYGRAQASFDRILNEFPSNQATTAAILLAAKSAYRRDQFELARTYLNGFTVKYGTSGYVEDARLLDEMAFEATKYRTEDPINLGILLSMNRQEKVQTQEMFNGIRIAIDEHNRDAGNRPVRMIFRDIDGGATATRQAMRELTSLQVDAVVGTLFSEDALAAAEEAERTQTLFVAPLATDDKLGANRRFTFQANPSMYVRGAAMARFAVLGLRLDSIAVILAADERKISERQADGFLEEASRLGAHIELISVLPDEASLYNLSDILPPDTLDNANAVYFPLASRNAVATVGAILSNLDRMNSNIRVIGNEGWQDLPQKTHASAFLTTYGDEFWIEPTTNEYQAFAREYKALTDIPPERLGVTGYDVATFMLEAIVETEDGNVSNTLRTKAPFQGLGLRIHFDGGNVNQALFYLRYRDNQLALIR